MSEKEKLLIRFEIILNRKRKLEYYYKSILIDTNEPYPVLDLVKDSDRTFTDPDRIQIGMRSPFYDVIEEDDLIMVVTLFMLTHECQHRLSTSQRAWEWGLKEGPKRILKKMSEKIEGIGARKFFKDSHYADFLRDLHEKHNIFVNMNQLTHICHFIQNSLEDGRIEKIAFEKDMFFRKAMPLVRSLMWAKSPIYTKTEEDQLKPSDKLTIIMNQILSLATNGLYQKGYIEAYEDSHMTDFIDEFIIDEIRAAVTSPDCMGAMKSAIAIEEMLADLIIDTCSMDADALEKAIKQLLQDIEEAFKPFVSQSDEERGSGNPNDDSEKDPTSEDNNSSSSSGSQPKGSNSEDQQSSGSGKRSENSEESEGQKSDRSDSCNAKESDSKDTESENKSASNNSEDTDSEEEQTSGSEDSDQNEQSASGSDSSDSKDGNPDSDSKDTSEEDGPQTDGLSMGKSSSSSSESGKASRSNGADSSQGSLLSDEDIDSMASSMKAAPMPSGIGSGRRNPGGSMDAASEDAFDKIKEDISSMLKQAANEAMGVAGDIKEDAPEKDDWAFVPDTNDKVTALPDTESHYPGNFLFNEFTREYQIDETIPVEAETAGRKLRKSIMKVFQPKKAPTTSGFYAGQLDPRRLTTLAMKQGNIYQRKGQVDKFSGCAYILMDNSGSMGYGRGSKREYACRQTAAIEYAIDGLVDCKITAFDSGAVNNANHYVIKNWGERSPRSFAWNFAVSGPWGAGNKDGYSIRVATKELLARPEKEKLLIIESDGCPSAYADYGEGLADVRDAVRAARRKGIKVVGIYFDDNPERGETEYAQMYEKNFVCTTPNKIGEELDKVFRHFILG